MSNGELAGSAGLKLAQERLDVLLKHQGVEPETRARILTLMGMMYEYIPWAIAQKKDPTNGKILARFLAPKGMDATKLLGNEDLNCGIAVVEFVLNSKRVYLSQGYPPFMLLAFGLSVIDLLSIGNTCDFASQAIYEAFLRKSSVTLKRVRSETQILMCVAPQRPETTTINPQLP